jgi:hypothetical protein
MAITLRITDSNGERVLTPGTGGVSCPTLEKFLTGDGPVSFQYTLPRDSAGIPTEPLFRRHAHVRVEDGATLIQSARIIHRDLPSSDSCAGPTQIRCQGYYDRLGDRKFAASTVYGPVYDGTSLADTPEEAIVHAVTSIGGATIPVPPAATGYLIQDDDDYAGRPAVDVVRAMSAYTNNLVTPFIGAVRNEEFTWQAVNLSFRYQVSLGNGVRLTPRDDATRLYTRVVVLFGADAVNGSGRVPPRIVTYPPTIDYTKLPTLVDLVVNAGVEIRDLPSAQRLAEGMYGRMSALELGWTARLEIALSATVMEGLSPVALERVQAGSYIRLADFDPEEMYGDPDIPTDHLITHATWNGENLMLELGDMREAADMARMVRQSMYEGSNRILHAMQAISTATRDANKTRLIGDPTPDDDSQTTAEDGTTPTPNRVDHGIPTVDTKQNTVDPTALPPQPPEVNVSFDPAVTGEQITTWHPPTIFTRYSLRASRACTVTVQGTRVSDSVLMFTFSLAAQQQILNQAITTTQSPLVTGPGIYATMVARDGIRWSVTVADTAAPAVTYLSLGIENHRYYPGYLRKNPITGQKTWTAPGP